MDYFSPVNVPMPDFCARHKLGVRAATGEDTSGEEVDEIVLMR